MLGMTPGTEAAIAAVDLRKRYGARTALAGVSISVARGEIVGLLGPNGAGKSTALSILATLLPSDEGDVRIAGYALPQEAHAARRALGWVPQQAALYPSLTGRENLAFFASMLGLRGGGASAGVWRALTLVGLGARGDDPVATYSGGMRRRLNLACGFVHAPQVLLLDEPTAGVDPQSREHLHATIEQLAHDGAAVLLSTHDMEEAERLCRRIVLLDEGRMVGAGTADELVGTSGLAASLSLRMLRPPPSDWLDGLASVRVLSAHGTHATLALDDPAAMPVLLARAARVGGDVVELRFDRPTLADAFFTLTGRALRDGTTLEGSA